MQQARSFRDIKVYLGLRILIHVCSKKNINWYNFESTQPQIPLLHSKYMSRGPVREQDDQCSTWHRTWKIRTVTMVWCVFWNNLSLGGPIMDSQDWSILFHLLVLIFHCAKIRSAEEQVLSTKASRKSGHTCCTTCKTWDGLINHNILQHSHFFNIHNAQRSVCFTV